MSISDITSHCVDTVFSWLIWIELFEYDETSLGPQNMGSCLDAARAGVSPNLLLLCWVLALTAQRARTLMLATAGSSPAVLPPEVSRSWHHITSPPTPEPETPTSTNQHCTVHCIVDHKICNHYKY